MKPKERIKEIEVKLAYDLYRGTWTNMVNDINWLIEREAEIEKIVNALKHAHTALTDCYEKVKAPDSYMLLESEEALEAWKKVNES